VPTSNGREGRGREGRGGDGKGKGSGKGKGRGTLLQGVRGIDAPAWNIAFCTVSRRLPRNRKIYEIDALLLSITNRKS